jgi:hypothetical protein
MKLPLDNTERFGVVVIVLTIAFVVYAGWQLFSAIH